jgi:L-threonylcarbamoyladenylate synthase
MILYPTETIYALGVNAFDSEALDSLYEIKGRGAEKSVSVLVRDIEDIERYAYLEPVVKVLVENFMPGPLTLVLKARDVVPRFLVASDGTLGFRISSDKVAQKVVKDFMEKYDTPLTCTSANLSGENTPAVVSEILKQFGSETKLIDEVYDDGSRSGKSSTVVRVVGEEVSVLRAGVISESEIFQL